MDISKKDLEKEIVDAIADRLSSYNLSEKAKRRIAKSGNKLAERLTEIFEKEERKAEKKEKEMKEDDPNFESLSKIAEDEDPD
jgi:hypothetical protein